MVRNIAKAGLVFILSAIFFLIFFYAVTPNALLNLNSYFFSTNHDGIKNYYTYLYYLKYDSGFHFSGMAYPYGDLITFTDNQPLLVLTLKFLNNLGIETGNHAVFIFNGLLLLSFPLASTMVYYILKYYKVTTFYAFVVSIIIILLNPQLERLAGHYALAYSFVIPLFWLLDIKLQSSNRKYIWSIIIVITTLLLTFLHVYYLAVSMLFYFFAAIGHALSGKINKSNLIKVFAVYTPAFLLPMLTFKLFMSVIDKVDDRVAFPFGFLFYRASYRTLFFNTNSPFDKWIPQFIQVGKNEFEGRAYLGVLALAFCVWLLYIVFKKCVANKNFSIDYVNVIKQNNFNPYIILGILALIIAAAFPFYMPPFDVVIEWITPLAQFRSPGRFAWIFFFVFMVFFYVFIYQLSQNKSLKWILPVVLVIGLYEGILTAKANLVTLNKTTLGEKFFDETLKAKCSEHEINRSNYQAIIAFPFYTIGNEKAGFAGTNSSILQSMKCSYQTGLPLVNYMMSRTGVKQGLTIAELTSHPIINKSYIGEVNKHKPFLLMISNDGLSANEQLWAKYASFIFKDEDVSYYQIWSDSILKMKADAKSYLKTQNWFKIQNNMEVYVNDTLNKFWYFSSSIYATDLFKNTESLMVLDGTTLLYDGKFPDTDSLTVSFWGISSNKVYGFPVIVITEYDDKGNEVFHYNSHLSTEMEFYQSARLVSYSFKPHHSLNRFKIETRGKQYNIANFCVYPSGSSRLFKTNHVWFWNNYPIDSFFLK